MSRGIGKMQRELLRVVEAEGGPLALNGIVMGYSTTGTWLATLGAEDYSKPYLSMLSALRRAADGLVDRGMLVVGIATHGIEERYNAKDAGYALRESTLWAWLPSQEEPYNVEPKTIRGLGAEALETIIRKQTARSLRPQGVSVATLTQVSSEQHLPAALEIAAQ